MPYANQHSGRVADPDNFEKDSFRSKDIAPGVRIIIGKKKGAGGMTVQAYRFDSGKFTPAGAREWLKDHDVKTILFEEAENTLEKARITKYIKREPDGKGGWRYTYKTVEDKIKLDMVFDANDLVFKFKSIGYEELIGREPVSEYARKKSKEIENNIKSFNNENVSVIDNKGNVLFSKNGNRQEVEFLKDEIDKLRNSEILTHTHPEDKSFSAEDIFLALSLGIKEIRVKTPGNTYFFRISHKKKSENQNELNNKNALFMNTLSEINKNVLKFFRPKVISGEITKNYADMESRKAVWAEIKNNPVLKDIFNIEYGEAKKND